jgi:hypothetical protein
MRESSTAVGFVVTIMIAAPNLCNEQRHHSFQIVGIIVGIIPNCMRYQKCASGVLVIAEELALLWFKSLKLRKWLDYDLKH